MLNLLARRRLRSGVPYRYQRHDVYKASKCRYKINACNFQWKNRFSDILAQYLFTVDRNLEGLLY